MARRAPSGALSIYTPTSASWLNQVDGFFGILGKQSLSGTDFYSKTAFREHLHAYMRAWNRSVIAPRVVPFSHPFWVSSVSVSAPAPVSKPSRSYPNASAVPLTVCDVIRKFVSKPHDSEPGTGPLHVAPVFRSPCRAA